MSYIGTHKIGGVYLGAVGIGKAFLGNDLVFQGGLPAGFTQLQYVSTDSTAYVDTEVEGAVDLEVLIKFYCSSFIQYGAIYGNYLDENHNCCRTILANANALYVGGGANLSQRVNGFSTLNIHTLSVSKTSAYLNGTRTAISAASKTANTTKICLGNRSVTAPVTRDLGLRIYSFKIAKNGTPVLNYVPCVRDSDSIAGFYDLVAGAFVRSTSGTDFTAGPTI